MDAKKFLFVSLDGLIADTAWHVAKEGHDVKLFIESQSEREIADGFVPKSHDWERDVKWADIVVFGGTPCIDRLEDDRAFGQQELKNAGVTSKT